MRRADQTMLAKESYIILGICLIDLVATIWLVATHRAIEGNPVMSFYLDRGWLPLIGVKLLLVVFPLFIAEWGRRYRPRFVRRALRLAIAMYVGVYIMAFANIDVMASARRITGIHTSGSASVMHPEPLANHGH